MSSGLLVLLQEELTLAQTFNHSFSHGELNPELYGRVDLQYYNQSAATLKNMAVMPGGSARKRFGSRIVSRLPVNDSNIHQTLLNLIPYQDKLLALYTRFDSAAPPKVYLDVYTCEIDTTTLPTDTLTDGAKISVEMPGSFAIRDFTATNDGLILTFDDPIPPYVIKSDLSAITPVDFINPPTQASKTTDYSGFTFTLSAVVQGSATLTSSSAIFDAADVGGRVEGFGAADTTNIGVANITAFTSTVEVTVDIIAQFAAGYLALPAPGGLPGSTLIIETPSWSDDEGWPRVCAFYEDRLIFANSRTYESTMWFSAVGRYNDFNQGRGLDSDAIDFTIASTTNLEIFWIISGRSLQIFTNVAVYASPMWGLQSLTPSQITFRQQTPVGCIEKCKPVVLEDWTIFAKTGGKSLLALSYQNDGQSFTSTDISAFSSHLIEEPSRLVVYAENTVTDGNILFANMKDDNTALMQSLTGQNVQAWSSTDASYKFITVLGTAAYFVNQTPLVLVSEGELPPNSTANTLLIVDWALPTDSTLFLELPITPPVFKILEVDDNILKYQDVESPELNFEWYFGWTAALADRTDGKWAGVEIIAEVETLPAHVVNNQGDNIYSPKRINRITIQYFMSTTFTVNTDITVSITANFDVPSPGTVANVRASGIERVYNFNAGWGRSPNIKITAGYGFMQILGVESQVSGGG